MGGSCVGLSTSCLCEHHTHLPSLSLEPRKPSVELVARERQERDLFLSRAVHVLSGCRLEPRQLLPPLLTPQGAGLSLPPGSTSHHSPERPGLARLEAASGSPAFRGPTLGGRPRWHKCVVMEVCVQKAGGLLEVVPKWR